MSELNLPSFYIIRHAQTVNNMKKLVNGHYDSELSSFGIEHAHKLSAYLSSYSFDTIFTSDLKRSLHTASLLFPYADHTKFKSYPQLRERNWGIFENQPIHTRPSIYSHPAGGESFHSFKTRIVEALLSLPLNKKCIIVGHNGVIRILSQIGSRFRTRESPNSSNLGFYLFDSSSLITIL